MGYEAWHTPSSMGPRCGVCGEPLRLDRRKQHECPKHRIVAHEIENLGADVPDYFPGAGVAHTQYDQAFVGAGVNAKEAYDDAVEQIATMGYDTNRFPQNPRGIRKTDALTDEQVEDGWQFYVVVRIRFAR